MSNISIEEVHHTRNRDSCGFAMFFFTKRQRQALIPGPRSGDLLSANAESVNTSRSGPQPPHEHYPELRPRQANPLTTDVSTCGFLNGNGTLSRTAEPGFDCRVDTKNAIWGFCPTTVISASDCGLAGGCVDAHGCQLGCGISDDSSVTTFTWFVQATLPLLSPSFPKA